jgi:hypothetical protein
MNNEFIVADMFCGADEYGKKFVQGSPCPISEGESGMIQITNEDNYERIQFYLSQGRFCFESGAIAYNSINRGET